MNVKLKPLDQQIIVITGATSGIGLVTARLAARRGARLMLIARSATALERLAGELATPRDGATGTIEPGGGAKVAYAVADVADLPQLEKAAALAIDRFGGYDTWVNNAGVSIYGRCADVPVEEQRKLFETNFWGVVHGSLVAMRHLKARGGALINLGSELSDLAMPLQASYVASKHAVKGYTDALRLELMAERAPVSVTLIKPSGTHTQFVEHARKHLEVEPRLPAPVYAPELVAEAILYAAVHPMRDVFVGAAGRTMSAFAHHLPQLFDRVMSRAGFRWQMTDRLPSAGVDALDQASDALLEHSGAPRHVFRSSLYTQAVTERRRTATVALGAAALVAVTALARQRGTHRMQRRPSA